MRLLKGLKSLIEGGNMAYIASTVVILENLY